MNINNYLTVDVEDYFQVSAFEDCVGADKWDSYPSRVEANTEKLLALFEEQQVKATFFILGWTANKFPQLVKKISRQGHEVACHSYYHRLVYNLTPDQFREDTRKAKDIIEQISGDPVLGYRAPSYSITNDSLWAVSILKELGFHYSSSVFPIYHDRYGIPQAPRHPFLWDVGGKEPRIIELNGTGEDKEYNSLVTETMSTAAAQPQFLLEIPISTSLVFNKNLPVSGGGYFRFFPYWFTKRSLRQINTSENRPFIFYLHPWEIDPGQPRMQRVKLQSRFRHYINLHRTYGRLQQLLRDFTFHPIHCNRRSNSATALPDSGD